MSPAAISARLREVADLSDLAAEKRLHGKIDYSPEAVSARIREVEQLRRLCLALGSKPNPLDRSDP